MTDYNEIDLSVTAELRDILGDELDMLYQEFIDQSSDLLVKLQSAAMAADLGAVVGIAHQLASSAGNLGFLPFSQCARALENGCRIGEISQPIDQVTALTVRYQCLLDEIAVLRQED